MNDIEILDQPKLYPELLAKSKAIGFTMPSDLYIGSLLKILITAKPKSRFLELGTGASLSLAWMVEGLDAESNLITVDNDPQLSEIAKYYFGKDPRIEVVCTDGSEWIKQYRGAKFDLIFADAWPGKYSEIEETLELVGPGGLYVIDDMTTQPNWPAGHQQHVDQLVDYIEHRKDFNLTKLNWSTGVIIAVKKPL